MKRILTNAFFTLVFACALLALSGASASAQHGYRLEKQLKFAAGKTSATVKGRIDNRLEAHEYTVKARAGQTLTVRLSASNKEMSFLVITDEYEPVADFSIEGWNGAGELPADGEYKINVSTARGRGNYTLSVEIKNR